MRKQIIQSTIVLLITLLCGCNIELFNKIEIYKKENIQLWAYRIGNTHNISVTAVSIGDAEIVLKKLPKFSIKLKNGTIIKSVNFTFDSLSRHPGCELYIPKITEDIQRQIDYGIFNKEEFQCKYLFFPGYKFRFNLEEQLEYIYIYCYAYPESSYAPKIGTKNASKFFQLPTKFKNIKKIFGDGFILTDSHW